MTTATKPCSCGWPDCPELGPAGEHEWNPLAEPVDDCGLCAGRLDRLPWTEIAARHGERLPVGPVQLPVRIAVGYAHPECVEP
jgi:hypothetical protein